jgi:hypothetical protein
MRKGRLFGIAVAVVVTVVVFAASAHASAGPGHDGGVCLACALCEWLNGLAA